MNTLESQNLSIGAILGGSIGLILGFTVSLSLRWSVGWVLFAMFATTLLGVGVGLWGAHLINRRFPPMLPFHRKAHNQLRATARRVRENLRRMTGLNNSHPEMDAALKLDAQLRVQASELRLQMEARARSELNWGDYIAAAVATVREGGWRELLAVILDTIKEQSDSGSLPGSTRSEWILEAYRNKLRYEIEQIEKKQARAPSDAARNALQHARAAKERELESFHVSEHAMHELESASAAIVAQIEHLYTETIRLQAQPHSAAQRVDSLLLPLRQQIEAYEQAVEEVQTTLGEAKP